MPAAEKQPGPDSAEDAPSSKRIKPSGAAEQYAEAVAGALARFWSGEGPDASGLSGLFGEQVVWHDSMLPGRELVGLERLQALRDLLRAALPDVRLRLRQPLAAGEQGLLLGYWAAEGTHSGALGPSLPPSGARASWEGSVLIRTQPQPQPQPLASGGAAPDAPGNGDPPQEGQAPERGDGAPAAASVLRTDAAPGQQQQQREQPGAAAPGPAVRGVEVWWSWDPIFLFQQLGWRQGAAEDGAGSEAGPGGAQAAEAGAGGEAGPGSAQAAAGSEAGPGATPGQGGAASEQGGGGGGMATTVVIGEAGSAAAPPEDDLAARTAAAARSAYATEEAAAAAAEAAVAAAAAAEARAGESAEALAAAQGANRAVVELYFHTYNTGHYRVLDHIVHPDYTYDGLLDLGGRRGRAAMAAMMGGWRDCLPDLAIGHELFAAVGTNQVTFRWVIRGTHATPGSRLLGVPCGGARLLVKGVTTLTLRGGRIARKVSHANAAHTLQQLGAARHPALPL